MDDNDDNGCTKCYDINLVAPWRGQRLTQICHRHIELGPSGHSGVGIAKKSHMHPRIFCIYQVSWEGKQALDM